MTRIPSLESLGSPRILVIGDLILDEYLWGDVSRISPEAPVPVLRVRHREHRCGGAGSVVENLVALGARVEAIGLVGADAAGRAITDRFEAQGVPTAGLISCDDRPTTLKTRMLGGVQHANRGRQQVLRVDQEEDRPVEPERVERAVSGIVRQLESAGESEIESSRIGGLVMAALEALDQVAYVRFASVYRNFHEAKDFEDFIGSLSPGTDE